MSAACEQHRPGPAARAAARLGGTVPVLDTRRLQLRGPRIYDFNGYASILTSDRAAHLGGPLDRKQAWAAFTRHTAQWMLHGHGLWAIDAQTMPCAGFVLLGYEDDSPEIGLWAFMAEGAEGHGYAQEAIEAARSYAFETLKFDTLVSDVDPGNARAHALMLRLGAVRDMHAEKARADGTHVWRHKGCAA